MCHGGVLGNSFILGDSWCFALGENREVVLCVSLDDFWLKANLLTKPWLEMCFCILMKLSVAFHVINFIMNNYRVMSSLMDGSDLDIALASPESFVQDDLDLNRINEWLSTQGNFQNDAMKWSDIGINHVQGYSFVKCLLQTLVMYNMLLNGFIYV